MKEIGENLLIAIIFIGFIAIAIPISYSNNYNQDTNSFNLVDLNEGVAFQVCTASVNSYIIVCDDIGYPVYNHSNEQINKMLDNCENTPVISKSTECIGDIIDIRKINGGLIAE